MKKINLLILVFLFLLCSFVSAKEPKLNTGNGLELKFPIFDYIQQDTTYAFQFHVYSKETGLAVVDGVNCTFHLYDNVGNHLYIGSDNVADNVFDFDFILLGGNFSRLGEYSYITYCECTQCAIAEGFIDLGGFVEAAFTVTKDGKPKSSDSLTVMLVLIFLIVLYSFVGVLNAGLLTRVKKKLTLPMMFLCFGLALAELVLLLFIVWADSTGGYIAGLLLTNFVVTIPIFIFVTLMTFLQFMRLALESSTVDDDITEKWNERGWP